MENVSAQGRRDIFVTMILPLFNAVLMLLNNEPSKIQREAVERLKKMLFKQFMGIQKRVSSELAEDMLRKKLQDIAEIEKENSDLKWSYRKTKIVSEGPQRIKNSNPLTGVPKEWIELVNAQYQMYVRCQNKTTNPWHMWYKHKIRVPNVLKIWREEVLTITEEKVAAGLPKAERIAN